MSRPRSSVAALAVGLAAAGVGVAVPGAAPPHVARVQVTADEFTLTLSRRIVRAGPAVVELVNLGEDDHDLALRRLAPRARTFRIRRTLPGGVDDLDVRLARGRYRLWCTLPGHRARGMAATLVVRRR